MATSQGFKCQFVTLVPDDLYCGQCNLVARRLTITNCCGESFCHDCIADCLKQDRPCPACEEKTFATFEHVKNHKRVNSLRVYCSLRERGCSWSGSLEQLDTHLDPDQDNCQYVDTKCPLNCHTAIPKNKLKQHMVAECIKRPFICQLCNFKATYEEVVNLHLPECKYVQLDCPNRCGETCARKDMEDHIKICLLEVIACGYEGCDSTFTREDQKRHIEENNEKHLALTASLVSEVKRDLQDKERNHKEEVLKLKQNLQEVEDKSMAMKLEYKQQLMEQEEKLLSQEKHHQEEMKKMNEEMKKMNQTISDQVKKLEELVKNMAQMVTRDMQQVQVLSGRNEEKISKLNELVILKNEFRIENFSALQRADNPDDQKGPHMYTHVGGYKFYIGVDVKGRGLVRGQSIHVYVCAIPGEYDRMLNWPAKVTFTIGLKNRQGERNVVISKVNAQWSIPSRDSKVASFENLDIYTHKVFMEKVLTGATHTSLNNERLADFLDNDTLHFFVSSFKT